MKALVLKDIILLKFTNLYLALAGAMLAFSIMSYDELFLNQLSFVFVIYIFAFFGHLFLAKHEVKTQGDIILNSLPVKRREIVKARYLTIIIYSLIIGMFFFITSHLISFLIGVEFPGNPLSLWTILLTIGLTLLFFSIYLPFYYHSIGRLQLFNIGFFMFLVLIPNLFQKYFDEQIIFSFFQRLMAFNLLIIGSLLLLMSLVLYYISLNIATKIYESKEF